MKIGVDYYPEQWDSKMWSRDAEPMAKSGIKNGSVRQPCLDMARTCGGCI